jgi:(p)ppGpp synthase/HD superfamily hydrolase
MKVSEHIRQQIELCLKIATEAHKGQTDKVGLPVILHPLKVGLVAKNPTGDPKCICVGFLHDTIEDTDMTYDKLIELGVDKDIADAVLLLTHDKEDDYFDYIQKIIDSKNMLAIQTKLNDLHHNASRACKYGFYEQYKKCCKTIVMFYKNCYY